MNAVVVWTWVGVVVLAALVMTFCVYEVVWKIRRLARDVEKLQQVGTELSVVQAQVTRARGTVTAITTARSGP